MLLVEGSELLLSKLLFGRHPETILRAVKEGLSREGTAVTDFSSKKGVRR